MLVEIRRSPYPYLTNIFLAFYLVTKRVEKVAHAVNQKYKDKTTHGNNVPAAVRPGAIAPGLRANKFNNLSLSSKNFNLSRAGKQNFAVPAVLPKIDISKRIPIHLRPDFVPGKSRRARWRARMREGKTSFQGAKGPAYAEKRRPFIRKKKTAPVLIMPPRYITVNGQLVYNIKGISDYKARLYKFYDGVPLFFDKKKKLYSFGHKFARGAGGSYRSQVVGTPAFKALTDKVFESTHSPLAKRKIGVEKIRGAAGLRWALKKPRKTTIFSNRTGKALRVR